MTTASEGRDKLEFGPVTVYLGLRRGKYPDCNQMILTGRQGQIAVDASRSTDLIGAHFDRSDLVVLSHVHEDHIAGLPRLPAVPVEAHHRDLAALQSWEGFCAAAGHAPEHRDHLRARFEAEFAYAPRPDARGYGDGAVWDLGGVSLRALPTPGHTPGHCSLLVEEQGLLFLGDIDLSSFGPYYGDHNSSLSAFRATLAGLAEIPARIWVTGHHRAVYTERARFLADLAAYVGRIEARNARLLAHLADGPQSLEALAARRLLYPPTVQFVGLEAVERRVCQRHLQELIAEDRVIAEAGGLFRAR